MTARNRQIGTGIHTVTVKEICAGAHSRDMRGRATGDEAHFADFWPEDKSNRSLSAALCETFRCEDCDSVCGYGREYLKRVSKGSMQERKIG